eukprot:Skav236320  [mRNA]  locus=scaffold97:136373:142711:+ [translate_table: standard]
MQNEKAGYVLHIGQVDTKGDMKVGDTVTIKVDYTRRSLVAKNHTATHILNYALRQVLGEKVDQKGSLVTEDKLRFDFSHGKPVDVKELRKIEEICNEMIQKSCVVHFRDVALDTAKAITGLRAVFGETYPDPVRVVSVGPKIDDLLTDKKTPWGMQNSVDFDGFKGMSPGSELDKCIGDLRKKVTEDSIQIIQPWRATVEAKGSLKAGKEQTKKFEGKAKEDGEKLGKEAAAASGPTFVGVVQAGAGCDDAKVLTPAMEAATKQCSDKAGVGTTGHHGAPRRWGCPKGRWQQFATGDMPSLPVAWNVALKALQELDAASDEGLLHCLSMSLHFRAQQFLKKSLGMFYEMLL